MDAFFHRTQQSETDCPQPTGESQTAAGAALRVKTTRSRQTALRVVKLKTLRESVKRSEPVPPGSDAPRRTGQESKLSELTFLSILCVPAAHVAAQAQANSNPETRDGPGEHGAAADLI